MKVKVTKTMAAAIKKSMRTMYPCVTVSMQTYKPDTYSWHVGSVWENEQDYDYTSGQFKVIQIRYPDEYYSMPHYLTTRDLQRIAGKCDGTLDGFMHAVKQAIEI